MPALAPPVTGERDALRQFLAYQQAAFVAVSTGDLAGELEPSCLPR